MQRDDHGMGHAIYLRTDTDDYAEEVKPFHSLQELVEVCARTYRNLVFEKVVIFASAGEEAHSLTLGFISQTAELRPEEGVPAALVR